MKGSNKHQGGAAIVCLPTTALENKWQPMKNKSAFSVKVTSELNSSR